MSEPDPNVMLQIEVEAKIAHESSMVIDLGGALAREVIRLRSVVDALRVECDAYKKDADDTTKLLKFVQQEMHDLVQGKLRFEGKADLEALLLSAVTQRDEYKMRLEASQEILAKVVAERNQLREFVKASERTVEVKVDQVEAAQDLAKDDAKIGIRRRSHNAICPGRRQDRHRQGLWVISMDTQRRRFFMSMIGCALTLVLLHRIFGRPHGFWKAALFGAVAGTVGMYFNAAISWLFRQPGCLVFDWGPPWQPRPRFERSNYHAGSSFVWLCWGVRYIPLPASKLMLDGAYPRCRRCQQHHPLDDLKAVPTTNGSEPMMCSECLAASTETPR